MSPRRSSPRVPDYKRKITPERMKDPKYRNMTRLFLISLLAAAILIGTAEYDKTLDNQTKGAIITSGFVIILFTFVQMVDFENRNDRYTYYGVDYENPWNQLNIIAMVTGLVLLIYGVVGPNRDSYVSAGGTLLGLSLLKIANSGYR